MVNEHMATWGSAWKRAGAARRLTTREKADWRGASPTSVGAKYSIKRVDRTGELTTKVVCVPILKH